MERINDQDESASKALIRYCKQVPSKVNLIKYNPIGDGKYYDKCNKQAEESYVHKNKNAGITVLIRRSREATLTSLRTNRQ